MSFVLTLTTRQYIYQLAFRMSPAFPKRFPLSTTHSSFVLYFQDLFSLVFLFVCLILLVIILPKSYIAYCFILDNMPHCGIFV